MSDSILILVRHGETVGQSSVRLYGATDIELSGKGREQMRKVGLLLADEKFQQVISSPLSRSMEGASIAADGRMSDHRIVKDFREINFGRWEGWTFEEAKERDAEVYAEWQMRRTDFSFPEGDSIPEFHNRVSNAAREVFYEPPAKTLAVLHKGVIRVIIASLLDIDFQEVRKYSIELGSIHRLEKTADGWRTLSINETAHLGESRIPESF